MKSTSNGTPRGKLRRFDSHAVNPLHLIHKWSIEHPYAVIAFYVAMIAMAWVTVTHSLPRRFAPYVPSPMVGVDPAEMDVNLKPTTVARYEHIKKSVGAVVREELPSQIQWAASVPSLWLWEKISTLSATMKAE